MVVKFFIFKVLHQGYPHRKALLPAVPPVILQHLKLITISPISHSSGR